MLLLLLLSQIFSTAICYLTREGDGKVLEAAQRALQLL